MKETFARPSERRSTEREGEIKTLQAKVGEPILGRDFFSQSLRSMSFDRGCAMIEAGKAAVSIAARWNARVQGRNISISMDGKIALWITCSLNGCGALARLRLD